MYFDHPVRPPKGEASARRSPAAPVARARKRAPGPTSSMSDTFMRAADARRFDALPVPTRAELLEALRFAQAAHGTANEGARAGIDVARWELLQELPAEERPEAARVLLGQVGLCELGHLENGSIGIAAAVAELVGSGARLVAHIVNAAGGDASLWLHPARRQVVLAWRGSSKVKDWVQDGKITRHEWKPGVGLGQGTWRAIGRSGPLQGASLRLRLRFPGGAVWSMPFANLSFRDSSWSMPMSGKVADAHCFMMHRGVLEQYLTDAGGNFRSTAISASAHRQRSHAGALVARFAEPRARVRVAARTGLLHPAVDELLASHPGFGLLVVGHSLGVPSQALELWWSVAAADEGPHSGRSVAGCFGTSERVRARDGAPRHGVPPRHVWQLSAGQRDVRQGARQSCQPDGVARAERAGPRVDGLDAARLRSLRHARVAVRWSRVRGRRARRGPRGGAQPRHAGPSAVHLAATPPPRHGGWLPRAPVVVHVAVRRRGVLSLCIACGRAPGPVALAGSRTRR